MIKTAAVVGSGYMGGGIAQVFASAGLHVVLADANRELTERNYHRLVREAQEFEAEGLFGVGSAARIEENLGVGESIEEAVSDVDYIEEAVPEKPEIKREVHERIDAARRPGAIVGSNTSTIRIESMAGVFSDASTFLGVHFSNPAPFIPGVEVIAHPGTSEETVALVLELIARVGKQGARIKDATGFVLNRLQYVLFQEAIALVDEGVATPDDVDAVVSGTFGFRFPFFGPFLIADMAGLDVYEMGMKQMETTFGEHISPPQRLRDLVAEGRHGVKTLGGFNNFNPETSEELVRYRNRAYARMSQLLEELGPPPGRK